MEQVRLRDIRLLVTGGRDYGDREAVRSALDWLHRHRRIALLITGMAGKKDRDGRVICGADLFAWEWAKDNGVPTDEHPVTAEDWKKFGRRAGPLRNQTMRGREPDLLAAWPGGTGTADMERRCAGLPVWHPVNQLRAGGGAT